MKTSSAVTQLASSTEEELTDSKRVLKMFNSQQLYFVENCRCTLLTNFVYRYVVEITVNCKASDLACMPKFLTDKVERDITLKFGFDI